MENKTGKYLKYAVGEIILVVIGILIALSLNNWNENEKLKKKEIDALQNIKDDLTESKIELKKASESTKSRNEELKSLIDFIVKKKNYDNSIDSAMGSFIYFSSPYLNYTSYESLKSSVTDLISNGDLLKSISKLYEYDFSFLMNDNDRLGWEVLSNVHLEFYTNNIEPDIYTSNGRPNDFKYLQNNQEFLNIIKLHLRHGIWSEDRFNQTSKKIDRVLTLIDSEILKLK